MEDCYVNLAAKDVNVCDSMGRVVSWTTSVHSPRRSQEVAPWGYIFAERVRHNPCPTLRGAVCYGGLGPFDEGTCRK